MITLSTAEFLISFLTFLLAYVLVVTFAGSFRAWTANAMGDDTAQSLGYASLNPFIHVDAVGIIVLVLFLTTPLQFVWRKYIPINPSNIVGKFRVPKLFCAYFSDVLAYLAFSSIAIALLLIFFGPSIIVLSADMMFQGFVSQSRLALAYPEASSMLISCALILVAIVFLSVFLAALDIIFSGFEMAMTVFGYSPYMFMLNWYSMILIYIAWVLLFSVLRIFVIQTVVKLGYILAHVFGVV